MLESIKNNSLAASNYCLNTNLHTEILRCIKNMCVNIIDFS